MLKLASDNLNRAVDALQNKLIVQTAGDKDIFKTREVFEILRRHHSALKKESEKLLDQKFDLQHKIFSPQRATEMAKNIFVLGGFKKLRSDFRRLKKDEENFLKISSPSKLVKIFSKIVIGLPMNALCFCKKNIFLSDKKLCSNLKILVSLI